MTRSNCWPQVGSFISERIRVFRFTSHFRAHCPLDLCSKATVRPPRPFQTQRQWLWGSTAYCHYVNGVMLWLNIQASVNQLVEWLAEEARCPGVKGMDVPWDILSWEWMPWGWTLNPTLDFSEKKVPPHVYREGHAFLGDIHPFYTYGRAQSPANVLSHSL